MTQKQDKGVNALAVGVAGVVAGAAAAAFVLSDEKKRLKLQKTMKDVQVWSDKKAKDLKQRAHTLTAQTAKKVDSAHQLVDKQLDMVNKKVDDMSDKSKKVLQNKDEKASTPRTHAHAAN